MPSSDVLLLLTVPVAISIFMVFMIISNMLGLRTKTIDSYVIGVQMKQLFKDLFSESGELSAMRVMCMLVCLTACYIALTKGPEELGVISTLLASAIGGKAAQKIVEVKSGVK